MAVGAKFLQEKSVEIFPVIQREPQYNFNTVHRNGEGLFGEY